MCAYLHTSGLYCGDQRPPGAPPQHWCVGESQGPAHRGGGSPSLCLLAPDRPWLWGPSRSCWAHSNCALLRKGFCILLMDYSPTSPVWLDCVDRQTYTALRSHGLVNTQPLTRMLRSNEQMERYEVLAHLQSCSDSKSSYVFLALCCTVKCVITCVEFPIISN